MKKCNKIIVLVAIIVFSLIFLLEGVYAHSGRTDSSGGHRDNKNKSGLGSYHYHCGGYPAHLHNNGVCPYSSTSSSSSNRNSPKASSSNTSTKAVEPAKVDVKEIKINEEDLSIDVGEVRTLTVNITPSNATDKKVSWKSNDESVVKISDIGEITAKKSGVAYITATSTNGKTNTIKVHVKETIEKNTNTVKNVTTNKDSKNITNNDDSSPLGIFMTFIILGGIGFLGYKKIKK